MNANVQFALWKLFYMTMGTYDTFKKKKKKKKKAICPFNQTANCIRVKFVRQ